MRMSLKSCWGTRTRTRKGRTRICSVTITPYPNASLVLQIAGAKLVLFSELPNFFTWNLQKKSNKTAFFAFFK